MVIFGVRLVCAATNLKCSIIGWPEKPSLPVTLTPSLRVVTRGKGDAGIHDVLLDAVEAPEEIEMPPGAAEFAVGDRLQADLFLLLDDALDLAVFDRLQRGGVDLALGALLARLLQARPGAAGCRHGRRGTAAWFAGSSALPPHFLGDFHDHPELRPLLVLGQDIAFLGRGEAALRRQTELIERRRISPPARCGA